MFVWIKFGRVVALSGIASAMCLLADPLAAQQKPTPMFYDARRLPDMEVERRNQEVLQEQRRLTEERRNEAEVAAKRKLEDARVAAQAERKSADEKRAEEARVVADAARKANDEKRVAAEVAAKKKAEDQRLADADAQLKRDEDTRNLALAEAKKKAEEVRIATLAAEAQRKSEDDKRNAAEAEAKRRIDEQQRVAAADAQRKLDDETRNAALAEAKKRAEDIRVAAAVDATRKAEEMRVATAAEARKKADEARVAAEAARKLDDEKQVAAAAAASVQRPTQTAALLAPPITNAINPATTGGCEAKLTTQPLIGGRMQVSVDSACRKGQLVTFKYGDYSFSRKLDGAGRATQVMDLFLGKTEAVGINYLDGKIDVAQPVAGDLTQVSKVALIWQSPVDLDLHAFENGAAFGKPGHISMQATGSAETARALMIERGRGAGFLSSIGSGPGDGSKMIVYTWFHSPEQDTGAVTMAVDYTSRGSKASGEMCGQGALAEVPFDTVIIDSKGLTQIGSGLIASVKCGETLSTNARYLRGVVPDLRFRR